jgi:hypothetical protein
MPLNRRRFITSGLMATTALAFSRLGNAEDQYIGTFGSGGPSEAETMMAIFRHRAEEATRQGFVGAFPNFYQAVYGAATVGGTIFVRASGAEWRDVPLAELGNPSLNDFGGRFRATQEYASRNGFVGGFPNFFHADYNGRIVCGTILVKPEVAEWRDVPLAELGANVSLNDVGGRFRGTQDYANRHGFVGGFPNMFHADYGLGIVCGTILLRQEVAEWQDVVLQVLR